jgi:hypothetical protein
MPKFTGEEEVLRKLVLKGTFDAKVKKDATSVDFDKLETLTGKSVHDIAVALFKREIQLPSDELSYPYFNALRTQVQNLAKVDKDLPDYKVCEASTPSCVSDFIRNMADYGILIVNTQTVNRAFTVEGVNVTYPQNTYVMVLPPFLAQHWDDYNSAEYIGLETIKRIYISNTRIDAYNFLAGLDKYLNDDSFAETRRFLRDDLNGGLPKIFKQNSGYRVAVIRTENDKDSLQAALVENTVTYITGSIVNAMTEPGAPRLAQKTAVKTIKERNASKFNDLKQAWLQPLRCLIIEPIPSPNVPLNLKPKLKEVVPPLKSAKPVPKGVLAAQTCIAGKCDEKKSVALGFLDDNETIIQNGKVVLNCDANYNPMRIRALADQIGIKTDQQSSRQICEKVKEALKTKTIIRTATADDDQ